MVTKGDTKEVPEGDRCENAQGNRSGRLERKGSSARKRVPKVVAKRIPGIGVPPRRQFRRLSRGHSGNGCDESSKDGLDENVQHDWS